MAYTYKKQTQFELFPGQNAPQEPGAPKSPRIFKDLTLSQEHIIVITIIFVVCMVVFFSMGVERGKKVALRQISQKIAKTAFNPSAAPLEQPQSQPQQQAGRISVKHEVKPVKAESQVGSEKREVLEIKIDEDLRYTIQVASFKQAESANKEAQSLKTKGFETFVMPKGSHSIVCVGKFAEKNDAQKYASKLQGTYTDYVIRRL